MSPSRNMVTSRRGQLLVLSIMTLVFGAMLFLGTWAIWQSGDTPFAMVWAAILTPVFGILVWMIVAVSREKRTSSVDNPEDLPVVPAGAVPPASQGRWSFEELARGIAARLADTPYTVRANQDAIVIHADLADERWRHLATLHSLKDAFLVTLDRTGSQTVRRTDDRRRLEWHAGVPSLGGVQATMQSGREWSYTRRVEYGLTEKGLNKAVDYTFSTGEINRPLQATLKEAGWRTELPAAAKGALAMAAMAVLPWIPIGIWALVTQT